MSIYCYIYIYIYKFQRVSQSSIFKKKLISVFGDFGTIVQYVCTAAIHNLFFL